MTKAKISVTTALVMLTISGCSTMNSKNNEIASDKTDVRKPAANIRQLECMSRDSQTTLRYQEGNANQVFVSHGRTQYLFQARQRVSNDSVAMYLSNRESAPASFTAVMFPGGSWVGHVDIGDDSTRMTCEWR